MTSRVDLHCHSTASQLSRLGVQRSLGLPECATPPREVYELAKRRGMDFVTITDHDTIDGCLELADRPDCFVSEELTARFAGEPQAVHVLCYGITPGDHEWLQAHAGNVEACAAYLDERGIACALAHPFYNVAAPLTRRHRRRLAELFPIWEVRNGSRAAELNMPAAIYVDTHGSTGIGGSDDHAGVDIGRTWTEVPAVSTPEELLARLRAGEATAAGEQGSAAKWAHAAMALATRALAPDETRAGEGAPNPATVLKICQRVVGQGAAREGAVAADIGPEDARTLLDSWLRSIGIEVRGRELIRYLQSDDFSHADLYRRARRIHDRCLRTAIADGTMSVAVGDVHSAVSGIFGALLPAIPYAPPTVFLGAEKAQLAGRSGERPRVALIADGIEAMHGVTHTIEQIRERGAPGFEVEVVGTDPGVDRRLPAATSLQVPFYEAMTLGVPGLPDLAETLAEGRYDLVHVTAPGPAGVAASLLSRVSGTPLLASYHTELRDLRRPAQRRRRPGGDLQGRARRLLHGAVARPLAKPRRRPFAARPRCRRGTDRPLGARRRHRALFPREGRPQRLPGRDQGPLRGSADPREGRRPARRELSAGAAGRAPSAPAPCRRRPRGRRAAGKAGRSRDLPRLARR